MDLSRFLNPSEEIVASTILDGHAESLTGVAMFGQLPYAACNLVSDDPTLAGLDLIIRKLCTGMLMETDNQVIYNWLKAVIDEIKDGQFQTGPVFTDIKEYATEMMVSNPQKLYVCVGAFKSKDADFKRLDPNDHSTGLRFSVIKIHDNKVQDFFTTH